MKKYLLAVLALLWGIPAWGQNLPPGTQGLACLVTTTAPDYSTSTNMWKQATCDLTGNLRVTGGGGGGGGNNYPGADYATSGRQDSMISSLGAPADAAYTGTGNAGNIALGKGQYAILSVLSTANGAPADTASGTIGANGSQIALQKAIRDKLLGTLAVTTTQLPAALGSATAANSLSVILATNQPTIPVSMASAPLPTGAATSAKQPALGTAGTPSTDVLTMQGCPTCTPQPVNVSNVGVMANTVSYSPGSVAASANYTTAAFDLGSAAPTYSWFSCYGLAPSGAGNLYAQWSTDNVTYQTYDTSAPAMTATNPKMLSYRVLARYNRCLFTNGTTVQTPVLQASATVN